MTNDPIEETNDSFKARIVEIVDTVIREAELSTDTSESPNVPVEFQHTIRMLAVISTLLNEIKYEELPAILVSTHLPNSTVVGLSITDPNLALMNSGAQKNAVVMSFAAWRDHLKEYPQ